MRHSRTISRVTIATTTLPQLWTRSFTLAVVATGLVFVGFYFLIPALPPFAVMLGASKSQVGVVIGVSSLAAVTTRLVTGHRLDRMGKKRFLLAGLLVFSVAAGCYGHAGSLPWLIALRVIQGVGWGWITTAFSALAADLSPVERRGEGIGYWGLGPPLAMAIGPLLGSILLANRGSAFVFYTTAALALLAALICLPIKEPLLPAPVDGALRRFERAAIVPAITLFLSSLSYGAIIAFVPVELASEPRRAGLFFTIYAISTLLTRPLAGSVSDRRGRLAVIHPGLLLSAVGVLLIGLPAVPGALWLAAILYGVGISGAFLGLMALAIDSSPPSSRGAAMAGFFSAYDLAIAFGALLLGPLYERFGFFAMNAVAAAAIVSAQGVLFAFIKRR